MRRINRPLWWIALGVTALVLSACGSGGNSSSSTEGCGVAGTTQACTCVSGESGAQLCETSGLWGPCTCGDDGDTGLPDGGVDSGDPDTGADTSPDAANDAEPDVDPGDGNACGGEGTLMVDDRPSLPGDACGECGGVLVCNGGEDLRCVGATDTNACGGCGELPGVPEDPCGPCLDGVWECTGDGAMRCAGATAPNGCGGCAELAGEPAWQCTVEGEAGTWVCNGEDETVCQPGGRNACGGSTALVGSPGAACGGCGLGRQVCESETAVTCDESDAPLNACGGCSTLAGSPGESCGECGTWACDDTDAERVVCVEERNACGGCGNLDGVPGDRCSDGELYCAGEDELACAGGDNACGGTAELAQEPGEPCGSCLDGVVQCASPEQTVCVGATALNRCGGCGLLPGVPGEICGEAATWTCREDGVLSCEVGDPLNACGGTGELDGEPGGACPEDDCDLRNWVCQGPDAVLCSGGVNGCGGQCNLLVNPDTGMESGPGTACGTCGSGVLSCVPDDRDRLACAGEDPNAFIEQWLDSDDDDAGDPDELQLSCDLLEGYVRNDNDCDDDDTTFQRNACGGCERFEVGEGRGDGCGECDSGTWTCSGPDSLSCEGDLGAAARDEVYRDADGDGQGDPTDVMEICPGETLEGYVANRIDCDDDNPASSGDQCTVDGACGTWFCGVGLECDTSRTPTWWLDADGDGYGVSSDTIRQCTDDDQPPAGYASPGSGEDCNDDPSTGAAINPGAIEIVGDGVDQNCDDDEICYLDDDGDGFVPVDSTGELQTIRSELDLTCDDDNEADAAAGDLAADCDDNEPTAYPGAAEVCDGIDNDCAFRTIDGRDEDWFRSACDGPDADMCASGRWECTAGDRVCDGDDVVTEIPGDEIDQDCDGGELCYRDVDGDGYAADDGTGAPATVASDDVDCVDEGELSATDLLGIDCQDMNANTYPGAPELCDTNDNNCNDSTADDGEGEPWFGVACDDDDDDACAYGTLGCDPGSPDNQICEGDTDSPQLCTFEDTDCRSETGPACGACELVEGPEGLADEYLRCIDSSERRSWSDAVAHCESLLPGSKLIEFGNVNEWMWATNSGLGEGLSLRWMGANAGRFEFCFASACPTSGRMCSSNSDCFDRIDAPAEYLDCTRRCDAHVQYHVSKHRLCELSLGTEGELLCNPTAETPSSMQFLVDQYYSDAEPGGCAAYAPDDIVSPFGWTLVDCAELRQFVCER